MNHADWWLNAYNAGDLDSEGDEEDPGLKEDEDLDDGVENEDQRRDMDVD